MAFYSYLSTKIIIAFITKSYQDLFGVRSYINALIYLEKKEQQLRILTWEKCLCMGKGYGKVIKRHSLIGK